MRRYGWIRAEDDIITDATEAGLSSVDIARAFMPYRSSEAIRKRRAHLRKFPIVRSK